MDVEGSLWDVRQIRDTKHGFDLLFGSPARLGVCRGGLPRLIATRPFADFWEARQTKQRILFDLPAGRTTLKRVCSRLGFSYRPDVAEFWQERNDDLARLKAGDFVRRYNVPVYLVLDTRRRLLGKSVRPLGWWRKPEFLQILKSNIPLRAMGENRAFPSARHTASSIARAGIVNVCLWAGYKPVADCHPAFRIRSSARPITVPRKPPVL